MLAGLQGLHPFIHSGPPNVKSNHHRHPREKHTHTYGRSCPSFCFCLREMKVCFKWMSPRSCRVAIIPEQTTRGRQSISKEKLTRKEKQAFHSHIGSYWERTEETILTYTKKGSVHQVQFIHSWMSSTHLSQPKWRKTRHSARCQ